MNTNYNREAFVRSLQKLCLLHRNGMDDIENSSELLWKIVPDNFNPLEYFPFKPIYTFESYGNTNEYLNHRYDVKPIFSKTGFLLDVTETDFVSALSETSEGYELWLFDDMTLAVTHFRSMKVRTGDKYESVTYRYFIKDGLYKFGLHFSEQDFVSKIEYVIAKFLCYRADCDEECDECEYDEIISAYENDDDEFEDDTELDSDYKCPSSGCKNCPHIDKCSL